MELALQRALPRLAGCRSRADVGAVAIDAARQALGAHIVCAIVLDPMAQARVEIRERVICGLTDRDFDEWDRDWRPADAVFPAAIARMAPVHNGQLFRPADWRKLAVYEEYGRRIRADHYLAAPLFGSRGDLAGMMTMCRRFDAGPFDGRSLQAVATLSGFLSATLGRIDGRPPPEPLPAGRLTVRELQVARLAAAGRNNLQIALELGIARETVKQTLRRVYAKLEVNGRAPMAARLSALGLSGE